MTERELMQQALDALEKIGMGGDPRWADDIAPALRARLAQPEQEPDYEAEFIKDWNEGKVRRVFDGKRMVPQREWQGLTDEEKLALWSGIECDLECLKPAEFARAIEAKLKEKNT